MADGESKIDHISSASHQQTNSNYEQDDDET